MPKYMPEKRFSFLSMTPSLDPETFGVVQFKGTEEISMPSEYDIVLVSDNPEIDFNQVLTHPAQLVIHREGKAQVGITGVVARFEQLHSYTDYVFYRVRLVSKLHWLSLTHNNQVFLGKTVPELIDLVLKGAGLTTLDYEFRLKDNYAPREYVCQYNESHLNFISRWLEREGLYYYMENTGGRQKIVFCDSSIAHKPLTVGPTLRYSQPAGLVPPGDIEVVTSFACCRKLVPTAVLLRDYNYERPALDLAGKALVDNAGRGTDYLFGEYFLTPDEGNRLAQLKAQMLACRMQQFVTESSVPYVMPGSLFALEGHYRRSFNREYLITSVTHEGNQTGYLAGGVKDGLRGLEIGIYYRNTFTAIESTTQFRPECRAIKPRISGTMHATIDAYGSGKYAELDSQGRYKVRLPFDRNEGHIAGKASCFLRMMQPYAGGQSGLHLPLRKGTEVLLTFVDGDPDRPIIAGAVYNPESPSPVIDKNATMNILRTSGGNALEMDDTEGMQRVRMSTPTSEAAITLGALAATAPWEPGEEQPSDDATGGIGLTTTSDMTVNAGGRYVESIAALNTAASNTDDGEPPSAGTTDQASRIASDLESAEEDAVKKSDVWGGSWAHVHGRNDVTVDGSETVQVGEGQGSYRAVRVNGDAAENISGNLSQKVGSEDGEWDSTHESHVYGDRKEYTHGKHLSEAGTEGGDGGLVKETTVHGDRKLTVEGTSTETHGKAGASGGTAHQITVNGDRTVTVNGKSATTGQAVSISASGGGEAFLLVRNDGSIYIKSNSALNIECSGPVKLKGSKVNIN